MRSTTQLTVICLAATLLQSSELKAQNVAGRLRPIGSASAVDQFRRDRTAARPAAQPVQPRNVTALWQPNRDAAGSNQNPIRQTVMMQSEFALPGAGGAAAGGGLGLPGGAPSTTTLPPNAPASTPRLPASAPFQETQIQTTPAPSAPPRPLPSPSDVTQIPAPQLPTQPFATVDNCNLITHQSSYLASAGYGCGNVVPTGFSSVAGPVTSPFGGVNPTTLPAQIPSSATLPPASVFPPTGAATAAPARALVSLGQENFAVQVGQGLWGQPVAYVPGQSLRNWLRYISP